MPLYRRTSTRRGFANIPHWRKDYRFEGTLDGRGVIEHGTDRRHSSSTVEIVNPDTPATPTPRPFQVGDRVRRIITSYSNFPIGDEDVITSVTRSGGLNFERGQGYDDTKFELVTSIPTHIARSNTMKYAVTFRQYIGYEPKLTYMPETMGETLYLTARRLKTFLAKTGLKVLYTEATDVPNVQNVKLAAGTPLRPEVMETFTFSEAVPKFPVTVPRGRFDGQSKDQFTALVQQLLSPVIKRPIIFTVPHARHSAVPTNPDEFQVYVWSTSDPDRSRHIKPPAELYGTKVDCRCDAYGPTIGVPIYVDEFMVAECLPNGLYISFDAVHEGTTNELIIFSHIMQAAANIYATVNFKHFDANREKSLAQAEERSLVEFAKRSVARVESRNKSEIRTLEAQTRAMQKELFNAERALATLRGREAGVDIEKQVLEEFRKLKAGFANIQEAKFVGTNLVVITAPINSIAAANGHHYHLGRVKISLPFDGGGNVYMTDPDKGRRIPHTGCRERGNTCLGNAHNEVTSYMANYEMLAAVTFMLAFLERGININDDWGKYLTRFPDLGAPE